MHRGSSRMPKTSGKERAVIDWLLEKDQPSIRYLTLTQLLNLDPEDTDAREAREAIPAKGWAADILAKQDPAGWWVRGERLYTPKYLSTNWMLLVLADLGMTREDLRIKKAADLWIERFAAADGGFGIDSNKSSHLCTAGNTARALVQFGYTDHPAVRASFGWFVKNASHLGGWSCFGSGRNLDSWEPMSAFVVYPREKWSQPMCETVEKAAEFFLQRELRKQGDHYEPWYRFHYPNHYYYDLLVGLDFMTALGYAHDPRLKPALDVLRKKRRPDGRWNLDAVHPDVEGATAEWFAKHPKDRPTPFALEKVGEPSKLITLRALRVLRRIEGA